MVTTTLTAATVIHIVNNRTNSTRKSTITNILPNGYTTPSDRTAVAKITGVYPAGTPFTTVV